MSRWTVAICFALGWCLPTAVTAADVLPPVSQRFAAATEEQPDFQRHMVPLLGKLGCNGRACHGSFQGRGGFRLSLFGYDFDMDHEGLKERIDTDTPADSYALQKPLLIEPHEGGKRLDLGSWEYNLFLKWIASGAPARPADAASLVRLEVTPSELIYQSAGQTTQLRAVAIWSDGSQEDVTCLCRFQSNDSAIADITADGLVTSGETGDTHVVVNYDSAVIPIPVIRPVSDLVGPKYPRIATSTPIDAAIQKKLAKLGLLPSEVCDDAEFLRRVSLDIAGTLPSAAEVRAFLSDTSADKRSRKINELLETPAYAAWWTTKLCDWTGANDQQLVNVNPTSNQSGTRDWYDWLYRRVAENMPYDRIMEGFVVAESRRPDESYRDYCERMSDVYRKEGQSVADLPGMIYFWGRTNFRTDEDRAIAFAYTFMGTRIQCAQCHKHPFDVWTQQDFQQFEKFFSRVRYDRTGDREGYQALLKELKLDGEKRNGNEVRRGIERAIQEGKTIPFPQISIASPRSASKSKGKGKDADKAATPQMARLLGSQEVDLANIPDPRTALMDWLRNDPKQLFAKALVNRVWANYFHRGIVEPTDDLSLANPPANQELLDYLSVGFVEHGYDLKWLHREICNSEAYQRSWRPNGTNAQDERNFSRAVPRRLPAEVAFDALQMATAGDARAATFTTDLKGRAVSIPGTGRNNNIQGTNYAMAVFGRSTRESNCDCDRSMEASLLQTIFTRNDNDVHTMLASRDGWVAQVSRQPNDARDSSDAERTRKRIRDVEEQLRRTERQLEKAQASGSEKRVESLKTEVAKLRRQLEQASPAEQPAAAPVATPSIEQLVEDAYLRTLSRYPTPAERTAATEFVSTAETLADGAKGLLWTLLNTKEFIVNH